jgi:hypothetical protein
LGIEKSKVTAEAIQAAQERAKSELANRGSTLDLSQISNTAPREPEEDQPAMFYKPEDEMSDEEQVEADPDGQLSIPDQIMIELKAASWPTTGAAFREVFVLIAVVIFTAFLVIQWDSFLRETYTGLGFIPSAEDLTNGSENMVLPDGWTNNMSEDDFMNFQDEVGSAAKSAPIGKGFPDL